MILRKIDYHEFDNTPNYWALRPFELGKINLLVGKNATGKTNTIIKIGWLGNMLAGFQPQLLNSGNYDIEFFDNINTYQYKLNLSYQKIQYEELSINGERKFNRGNDGIGKIFSAQFKRDMDFQLSPNQLVVTSKRDAIQHPFLEELARWAEGQRTYEFSSKLGQDTILVTNDMNNILVDPRDMDSVIGLFVKGEQEFAQDFRKEIISSMKEIGYELSNIGVTPNRSPEPLVSIPGVSNGLVLYIGEKNSKTSILQPQMSQGMFRALSLIIQITYNTLKKLSTTILIDDIGEGLDFDRSSRLIRLLIEIAEKNDNIQLIMSTNDRFVMNNVPLEYWQVIQREGGECTVYNYHNSKGKFDEFEYMGLNNFDFLATDYLNSQWEKV
jgi:AAA15 family ATPase/GTPase